MVGRLLKQSIKLCIANCGLQMLELLASVISPCRIDEMPFVDLCIAIEHFLVSKKKLIVTERVKFCINVCKNLMNQCKIMEGC